MKRYLPLLVVLGAVLCLTFPPSTFAAQNTPVPFPTFGALPPAPTNPPANPIPPTVGALPTQPPVVGSPTPIPTVLTATPAPPTPTVPTGTPPPGLRKTIMGVQIHSLLSDRDWDTMLDATRGLGVKWIKIQVNWEVYQPTRGQFGTDYQALVLRVQRARVQGFRTLLSVAKAPDWSRTNNANNHDGPPADPNELGTFLRALIRDIKPEFIDAIEVWNEANLIREWGGVTLNGGTYMRYFDVAYKAIREQEKNPPPLDPNHRIAILVGAPAPAAPNSKESVNDRDWWGQVYAAGLAKYGEIGLGVHPYGWANPPESTCCKASPGVTGWYENRGFYFKDTLDDTRAIAQKNKHNVKLWITEFGWSSFEGLIRTDGSPVRPSDNPALGWSRILNQTQQADYVFRAYRMLQAPPYSDFVGPAMLWNMNFGMIATVIDEGREEGSFSLLNYRAQGRPVYNVIASAPDVP